MGADEALNLEVRFAAVHARRVGECVDGLETHTESANCSDVVRLRASTHAADTADVVLSERTAVVSELEVVGVKVILDLACASVLCVLKQFVDEVGLIGVKTPEKLEVTSAFAVLANIVLADLLEVCQTTSTRPTATRVVTISTSRAASNSRSRSSCSR